MPDDAIAWPVRLRALSIWLGLPVLALGWADGDPRIHHADLLGATQELLTQRRSGASVQAALREGKDWLSAVFVSQRT
jgi:hypothetical protein